jgi:hypothetical protein
MAYTNYGLAKGLAYKAPWMQMIQMDEYRKDKELARQERKEAIEMQKAMWIMDRTEFANVRNPYDKGRYNNFLEEKLPELSTYIDDNEDLMYNPSKMVELKRRLTQFKDNDIVSQALLVDENYNSYVKAIEKNPDLYRSPEAKNYRDNYRAYINQSEGDNIPVPYWNGASEYDWLKNLQTNFKGLTGTATMIDLPHGKKGFSWEVSEEYLNQAAELTYEQNPMFWDNFAEKTAFQGESKLDMIKRMGRIHTKRKVQPFSTLQINLGGANKEPVDWVQHDIIDMSNIGSPNSPNAYLKYLINQVDDEYQGNEVWMMTEDSDNNLNYFKRTLPRNYNYNVEKTSHVIIGNELDQEAQNYFVQTTLSVDAETDLASKFIKIYEDVYGITPTGTIKDDMTYDEKKAIIEKEAKVKYVGWGTKYRLEFDVVVPLSMENKDAYNKAKGGQESQKGFFHVPKEEYSQKMSTDEYRVKILGRKLTDVGESIDLINNASIFYQMYENQYPGMVEFVNNPYNISTLQDLFITERENNSKSSLNTFLEKFGEKYKKQNQFTGTQSTGTQSTGTQSTGTQSTGTQSTGNQSSYITKTESGVKVLTDEGVNATLNDIPNLKQYVKDYYKIDDSQVETWIKNYFNQFCKDNPIEKYHTYEYLILNIVRYMESYPVKEQEEQTEQ